MTDAAVLLPLYGWPEEPGLVFTERRADLRRHAGEISFPGGRKDQADADLATTALREAEEEIGLDPAVVELGEELPTTGTFVTGYASIRSSAGSPTRATLTWRRTPRRWRPSSPSRWTRSTRATRCAA